MSDHHPCAARPLDPLIKERLAVVERAHLAALHGSGDVGAASEADGTVDRLTSAYYGTIDAACPPGPDKTAALRCVRLARQALADAAKAAGFCIDASPAFDLASDQITLALYNARESLCNCDPSALPPLPTQE